MLSDKWCFKLNLDDKNFRMFTLTNPVSKKQAAFLLRKKLNINHYALLVPCDFLKDTEDKIQ